MMSTRQEANRILAEHYECDASEGVKLRDAIEAALTSAREAGRVEGLAEAATPWKPIDDAAKNGMKWELVAEGEIVPESWIRGGGRQRRTLLRARDAREEYEFARRQLGFGHPEAITWLRSRFQVTERHLLRWGFTTPRSEIAS